MENVILHALLSLSFPGRGPSPPVVSPGEECYGPLGCFSADPPWAGIPERPVAVLPMPVDITTPVFCFYTPARPTCHELFLNNIGSIYNAGLEETSPLIVMTHGYIENAGLDWMVKMRDTMLDLSPNVGVITVDWSMAAQPPYAQAVANIRVAGAATGYLVHILAEYFDFPLTSVHLVGHSLGAHFMSYAGDFVKNATGKKVGRITGLDPAGPYFVNVPPMVRLDPSDAEFVDVIHTDIPKEAWEINKLGHPDPLGHVDYYPNGGLKQAGCQGSAHASVEKKNSLTDGVVSYIGCNHQRSHAYFTESILSKCRFQGITCESWEKFLSGSCWGCESGHCSTMGFHATPSEVPKMPLSKGHQGVLDVSSNRVGRNRKIRSVKTSNRDDVIASPNTTNGGQDLNEGISSQQSSSSPVIVFLGTNPSDPFCAEQYKVTVVTSSALPSQESGGDIARFTVRIRGQLREVVIPPPEEPTFIEPGGKLSWVGFSSELGPLTALQIEYEKDHGILHSLIWRFSQPTLYIDSFTVEELSTGAMTHFQHCGSKMEAGESLILFPENKCEE